MIGKEILNYTIVSFIGKGGMGSVYLAEHKYIKQQKVAIKVINADMVNDFTRSRLQQEAEALARLNHPNIVHFLDYHIDEGGNIYLIEEYAEGVSLEKYIKEVNGLIVEDRLCAKFEPILDAMNYAHKMHILHRDLKPSNIIITEDGTPKILDFGIATLMREDAQDEGLIMGTPTYMSPEQVKGEKLDERSDIYSLGVVLFQMLTGVAPYDATTMSEFDINKAVVEEDLPRLKSYYKYTSDAVQKVVDKATCKDKTKRYQSCADFRKALHQAIYPATISLKVKIAASIASLLVIGAGLYIWDYNRTKVTYYKDYALHWGVPIGIGEVDTNTMHHRRYTYRFETKAGKVLSVGLVNSFGNLTDHSDSEHSSTRYSLVNYFYSSNGNLDYKVIYSSDSVILYQMDYSDNMRTVTFRRDDQFHTEMDLQAHTTKYTSQDNIFERSRISRYLLTYDENGLVTEKLFAGFQNIKRCDADHIYGIRYKYDEQGRVIEEQFIGIDGNIKGNSFGLAIKEYTYDENNDWTSVTYLNAEHKQSHDGNNCCIVKLNYDQWGNRIRESYFSLNGEPTLRTDEGSYGFSYEFDDNGLLLKTTTLGPNFEPAYCSYGFVAIINQYDENGYQISTQCVDEHDNPLLNTSNDFAYSRISYDNDCKGHPIVFHFYDEHDSLCESDGVATMQIEYNDKFNPIQYSYFDANSEPALYLGYFHRREMEYDSLGQQIAERYYDSSGNLTNSSNGYAEVKWVFDVHGACTQIAFYSRYGHPTMNNDRYAFNEVQYDEQGNIIWSRYFSPQHASCMTAYGYSAQEYQYDPVTNNETVRIDYNAKGDVLKKHFYEYDSRGNLAKTYTTNANNKLEEGTVVYHYAYDDLNRQTREWYTDLNDNPCNLNEVKKYAEERYEYDENSNITVISYYDSKGEKAINEEFVHRRERTFNSMRKVVRELFLGKDLKPVTGSNVNPEGTVIYDNYGRMLEIACFDGYGKPRLSSDGFHKELFKYDYRGLVIGTTYLDINGELTESKSNGYAKMERDYNAKRLDTESRYYNQKNECIQIEQYSYNERGKVTSWHIFNGKRQYDDSKYGFSKLVIDYDESGSIPVRRMCYQKGDKMLAWQKYDSHKNDWGDWQFGALESNASTGKKKAQSQSNSASRTTTNNQWRHTVANFNSKCPAVVKKYQQYTLKVISAVIVTDRKIKVTFRTSCSKYEIMETDVKSCIETCKQLIQDYKKQWDLPSNVTIIYELQDSKNRILN